MYDSRLLLSCHDKTVDWVFYLCESRWLLSCHDRYLIVFFLVLICVQEWIVMFLHCLIDDTY